MAVVVVCNVRLMVEHKYARARTLYPYTLLDTRTGPQRSGSSRRRGGDGSAPAAAGSPLVAVVDDDGSGGTWSESKRRVPRMETRVWSCGCSFL